MRLVGASEDRRWSAAWALFHALAVMLLFVSGADHVVVPSLTFSVHRSDLPEPDDVQVGVEDFCRIRQDQNVRDVALPRTLEPAPLPRTDVVQAPGPVYEPSSFVRPPLAEHTSLLGLRARSPG